MRELRDTGVKLLGSSVFVELDGLDKSHAHIRTKDIEAMLRFWIKEAEKRPPPAPPKPMSAEERVDRLAEYGHLKGNSRSARPECNAIMGHIRDAESAAFDRAISRAVNAIFDAVKEPDPWKAGPLAVKFVQALEGKCHASEPA